MEEVIQELAELPIFRKVRELAEELPSPEREEVLKQLEKLLEAVLYYPTEVMGHVVAIEEIFNRHQIDGRFLNKVVIAVFTPGKEEK